jgi:spermidine synthase
VSDLGRLDNTARGTGLIAALFLLAGMAALINQSIWVRWLALILGSSSRAAVVVLAVFMAGLGVGSWWGGRWADRATGLALRRFGWLEIGIGAWAIALIPLTQMLPQLALWVAPANATSGAPLAWRVVIAAACLGVPTFLMGATLPLLVRWVEQTGRIAAPTLAWFYAANTLGGALGTLLAVFVLVDRFGLSGSALFAGGLEIAVGIAALTSVRSQLLSTPVAPGSASALHSASPVAAVEAPAWTIGALALLASGFVGLALEVILFRIFAVLLGSSVYAFAMMLTAFLVGIALGSWAAGRLATRSPVAARPLIISLALVAFGTGLSLWLLQSTSAGGVARLPAGLRWAGGVGYSTELVFCLLVVMPVTLALGAAIPAVTRITHSEPNRVARRFGLAYAANTLGAVLGAVLAGVLFIPRFGTASSARGLVLFAVAVTLAIAVACDRSLRTWGTVAVLGGLGWWLASGSDPARQAFEARFDPRTIVEFREGPVQTIAVIEEDNDQQLAFLRLVTNQTSLTGTHLYAARYMRLLGHLPVLFSADPRRVMVICLGTGMTAAAVASHDSVEQVDLIELSPEVAAVDRHFESANDGVLDQPKVQLVIEDGRQALLATGARFGAITLEPPPPRDAGVVSLYSRDFYALARQRLVPGGVLAQWIPLHSQSLEEVKLLTATFLAEFEQAAGFMAVERDLILLGSDRPLTLSPQRWERELASVRTRESLERIGFDRLGSLLATQWLSREQLVEFVGAAPIVTDDRPSIEHFARFGRRPPLPSTAELRSPSSIAIPSLAQLDPTDRAAFEATRSALRLMFEAATLAEARRPAREWSARFDAALRLRPHDRYMQYAAGASDEHLRRLRGVVERAGTAEAWNELAQKLDAREQYDAAIEALEQAHRIAPSDLRILIGLGKLRIDRRRDPQRGYALMRQALANLPPSHPSRAILEQLLKVDANRTSP